MDWLRERFGQPWMYARTCTTQLSRRLWRAHERPKISLPPLLRQVQPLRTCWYGRGVEGLAGAEDEHSAWRERAALGHLGNHRAVRPEGNLWDDAFAPAGYIDERAGGEVEQPSNVGRAFEREKQRRQIRTLVEVAARERGRTGAASLWMERLPLHGRKAKKQLESIERKDAGRAYPSVSH